MASLIGRRHIDITSGEIVNLVAAGGVLVLNTKTERGTIGNQIFFTVAAIVCQRSGRRLQGLVKLKEKGCSVCVACSVCVNDDDLVGTFRSRSQKFIAGVTIVDGVAAGVARRKQAESNSRRVRNAIGTVTTV